MLMLCNYSAILCKNAARNNRVRLPAIERQCPPNAPIKAKKVTQGIAAYSFVLHILALLYADFFS
jgi:hypothetical protein